MMVGLAGIEPATSPLSGVRSNRLSYSPSTGVLVGDDDRRLTAGSAGRWAAVPRPSDFTADGREPAHGITGVADGMGGDSLGRGRASVGCGRRPAPVAAHRWRGPARRCGGGGVGRRRSAPGRRGGRGRRALRAAVASVPRVRSATSVRRRGGPAWSGRAGTVPAAGSRVPGSATGGSTRRARRRGDRWVTGGWSAWARGWIAGGRGGGGGGGSGWRLGGSASGRPLGEGGLEAVGRRTARGAAGGGGIGGGSEDGRGCGVPAGGAWWASWPPAAAGSAGVAPRGSGRGRGAWRPGARRAGARRRGRGGRGAWRRPWRATVDRGRGRLGDQHGWVGAGRRQSGAAGQVVRPGSTAAGALGPGPGRQGRAAARARRRRHPVPHVGPHRPRAAGGCRPPAGGTLLEHDAEAADEVADQVVEDAQQHGDARAQQHQQGPADERRPQQLATQEVEVLRRHQVADEALDVAPQPGDRRRRPQGEAGHHQDQVQAGVEQQRELQHRPRLDPAQDQPDSPCLGHELLCPRRDPGKT